MGMLGKGSNGKREPMSKVDTAWLRMESPTNLMMITGVMMFAEPMDLASLKRVIGERFLAYRRFRQKAVDTPTGAFWETDADFDLDWHVRLTALPGKAGQEELQNLVSQLGSSPLDHSKPLWQFHLVERYKGGSAVIPRIHHCYADGIALVQVILSLTDVSAKPKQGHDLARAWLKDDGHKVTQRFFDPAMAQIDKAMKLGGKVLEKGMEMYRHPSLAGVLAKEGGEIARELAYALSLPDDPETQLRGPLGVSKRCAWAEPMDLEEVKTVGRALGCTVNDVLLTAATGALRSYLLDNGGSIDGLTLRATVPVNLRPLEHAKKLGNHFGLVFLDLPVGESNPLRRLRRVSAHMHELKNARQAAVTFGLLAAVGMTTPAVQRMALELFSRKASIVATNVPGPQMPLYMAGSRISELMVWVPQNGSIGIGISILSYSGKVHFGLISDAKRIADPGDVIRRFKGEFEKLLYITLMEDWEQPITPEDADATLGFFCGNAGGPVSKEFAEACAGQAAEADAYAKAKAGFESEPSSGKPRAARKRSDQAAKQAPPTAAKRASGKPAVATSAALDKPVSKARKRAAANPAAAKKPPSKTRKPASASKPAAANSEFARRLEAMRKA